MCDVTHGVLGGLYAKACSNDDETILSTGARVAIDQSAAALVHAKYSARFVGPAILLLLVRLFRCDCRAPVTPVCTPGGRRSHRRS